MTDDTFERPITPECDHPQRYPGEPTGYLPWFEWADRKQKTHRQKFCDHCRRFAIWVPR